MGSISEIGISKKSVPGTLLQDILPTSFEVMLCFDPMSSIAVGWLLRPLRYSGKERAESFKLLPLGLGTNK